VRDIAFGSRRAATLSALWMLVAAGATSQCVCDTATALVTKVGAGCGTGAPTFNSTPPVLGEIMTFFVTSSLQNAALFVGSSSPPAAPFSTPGGCAIYLNLADLMISGPFLTNAQGGWIGEFASPADPSLCGLVCNVQVVVEGGGGPDPGFRVTNALQETMGCAPRGSRNGFPSNAFCSYTQGGYSGGGVPGQIFDAHFLATFPSGFEVGQYHTASGDSAPNGLRFTATPAGQTALKAFIPGGGASGVIASDQLDPASAFGGGSLAYQAVALGLNVGFNDSGVAGSPNADYSSLIYVNPGDSLSGQSVSQILAAVNTALAGLGVPAGQSLASLASLATNLNESFDNCTMSAWASSHLFAR
jgi:hypothetical protein